MLKNMPPLVWVETEEKGFENGLSYGGDCTKMILLWRKLLHRLDL